MNRLETALEGFEACVTRFRMPDPTVREVRSLRANTNWSWGHERGLYCFVRDGEVLYVGRAIGATFGARLWDHLNSKVDPKWADAVGDDDTLVLTYSFEPDQLALAAALEVYVIESLRPPFNKRVG